MSRNQTTLVYFALLPLIIISNLSAQSPQILFESANRDYFEGNYEQAVEKYQKILENNVESGEVYFNLGNSYYKLDEYGRAILYFEKAKKYLSGDDALEKNLKLAQLHIIDEIEPIPQLFIKVWWNELLNLFSLEFYAWISLFLFTLLTFLIAINILQNKNIKNVIWVVASVVLFVLVIFINKAYIFETTQFGIILSDKVSIVSEPSLTGTEMFILHEGTKIQILRQSGAWLEIKIADGKTGWLNSTTVEKI
jgi:tetratricopeptide (TPR) repeat protein